MMIFRALMHFALAASLLLFALMAGAAEVIRFGYLELNKDARYDERKAFFRTLSRPFGPPFAGAETLNNSSARPRVAAATSATTVPGASIRK